MRIRATTTTKKTNQRKCENVSYDFIAIKMCFDSLTRSRCLLLEFLWRKRTRRRQAARGKKQSNKTLSEYTQAQSLWDTLLMAGLRFHLIRNSSTHQMKCTSLFYWFQLSGNEIDSHTHTHSLIHSLTHSDTQTHTWLVLKWNSSNENWCLSRNCWFSSSTIKLNARANPEQRTKEWETCREMCHKWFSLAKRFSNKREDHLLLIFSLFYVLIWLSIEWTMFSRMCLNVRAVLCVVDGLSS